jgi:hypothetical protein
MKNILFNAVLLLSLAMLGGCDKTGNYPGGKVSPYVSIYDVRDIYKGQDVTLTRQTLYGSSQITAMVVSDHSGGNLPAGLLVVQERRRLSQLRGISIDLGAEAAKYVPGDSVTITIEGGVLKTVNGILQITGVPASAVTKVSSGNSIPVNRVPANLILARPENYESTLVVIVKAGFNPLPSPTDVLAGNKVLNDAFGNLTMRTEATATFANNKPIFLGNYTGIIFNTIGADKVVVPNFRLRTGSDIVLLSSTISVAPIIITGFMSDPNGTDVNNEYMQFMATRDINFSETPFSVVTTNNAGTNVPTGAPVNGWATGQARTYKFNLTSGTAAKGTFFYVGGTNRLINGPSSTSISNANWIRSHNYSTTAGDGFGTASTNLLANSGNATGLAVFAGITITAASIPIDVMFLGTGGSLLATTPTQVGYRIGNTDWYDIINPITLQEQPFYRSGTNTLSLSFNTTDLGFFYKLGGEYNVTLGRWMKARSQTNVLLTKQSQLNEIEGEGSTKLLQ